MQPSHAIFFQEWDRAIATLSPLLQKELCNYGFPAGLLWAVSIVEVTTAFFEMAPKAIGAIPRTVTWPPT